jgi:cation transport ATPase
MIAIKPDIATEAAKIVLMQSDPLDILKAIILSKAIVRKVKQNLIWANGIFSRNLE